MDLCVPVLLDSARRQVKLFRLVHNDHPQGMPRQVWTDKFRADRITSSSAGRERSTRAEDSVVVLGLLHFSVALVQLLFIMLPAAPPNLFGRISCPLQLSPVTAFLSYAQPWIPCPTQRQTSK